jgi:two-component system response regulator DesR
MIVAAYNEIREGLSTVLRLAGSIEVAAAAPSLSSAACQASLRCPDVALVDLEMPGGEGYEAIHQLKRLCPRMSVIALTAHDYPAARESAARVGASMVIVKGLSVPEMIAAVQAAVESNDTQQGRSSES